MSDHVIPAPHLTIRPGGLHDTESVAAMHARCSDLSLFRRFHAPLPCVSTRMIHQLLAPTDGWSVLGQVDGDVVGLACAAPTSAPVVELADLEVGVLEVGVLEVGVLVEDRHQRHGVGARLLHAVAVEAAARGHHSLQLLAQPDNDAVLATVRRTGLVARVVSHEGLLQVSVPVHRLATVDLPRTA